MAPWMALSLALIASTADAGEPLRVAATEAEPAQREGPTDAQGPSFGARVTHGAVVGVATGAATLALSAAIFSSTIAFATLTPPLAQLVLFPLFPLTLLIPPAAAVVVAVGTSAPTTTGLGAAIVGGTVAGVSLVAFLVTTVVAAPLLLTATTSPFAPGGGLFEGVLVGAVLAPPLATGLAAAVATAFVVDEPLE